MNEKRKGVIIVLCFMLLCMLATVIIHKHLDNSRPNNAVPNENINVIYNEKSPE